MNITTTFKVRHIQEEHAFEMEYFHDDNIYQVRIMEFNNNQWHIKQSMELLKIEATWLMAFLDKTLKVDNL
jgi:hypothetical protein